MKLINHLYLYVVLLCRDIYKDKQKCKGCTKTGEEETQCCMNYKT